MTGIGDAGAGVALSNTCTPRHAHCFFKDHLQLLLMNIQLFFYS